MAGFFPEVSRMQTAECPVATVQTPFNRSTLTRFTRESARIASAKGVQAKRDRKDRARQAALEPIEPAKPKPEFTDIQRARTRRHIARLNSMLDSEVDPAKLDRLAAALAKLAEIERQLSGRPLPGSYRPSNRDKGRPGGALDATPLSEG